MTRRNTMLTATTALIALLAFGSSGPAAAQSEEPGIEEPSPQGPWGEKPGWERGRRGGRGHRGPGMGGPGAAGAHGLRFALRNLDLSEAQREEVRAIFENERDEVVAAHERMRALGEELRGQIETDPYDEDAVRAKAAAVASQSVEMAVLRARQSGQVRDVLTADQLDRLEQMKEQRQSFREERHERFERRRQQRSNP